MRGVGEVIDLLLVEDNPGDIRLTQEALREGKIRNKLDVVTDGAAAIDELNRRKPDGGSRLPDLILLDLNLPKKDGRQVLAEIKQDPELKHVPVIILTTSDADKDVFSTYEHHANCYIQKPVDLAQFVDVIKSIECFWFSIVKLPSK